VAGRVYVRPRTPWHATACGAAPPPLETAHSSPLATAACTCGRPGIWLNDEVIEYYNRLLMTPLMTRENPAVRAYWLPTFFYPILVGRTQVERRKTHNFDRAKPFTRADFTLRRAGMDNIFRDAQLILVPLHLDDAHWALAVVDLRRQNIYYYDSLLRGNFYDDGRKHLKRLQLWLADAWAEKGLANPTPVIPQWPLVVVRNIPQQRNGYDCGVFSTMFGRLLAEGKDPAAANAWFTQVHVTHLRYRMALEIWESEKTPGRSRSSAGVQQ
jgi:sentrin-specific protease 1